MTASPQCTTGKEKQRGFSKLDCLVKHSTKLSSSISISGTNSYWLHQLSSHPLEEHLYINGLQNIPMSSAGNLDKEHITSYTFLFPYQKQARTTKQF